MYLSFFIYGRRIDLSHYCEDRTISSPLTYEGDWRVVSTDSKHMFNLSTVLSTHFSSVDDAGVWSSPLPQQNVVAKEQVLHSQFVFVECYHSRHPDVSNVLVTRKVKVPNTAVDMNS